MPAMAAPNDLAFPTIFSVNSELEGIFKILPIFEKTLFRFKQIPPMFLL
jgi:hypothetical protein